MRNNLSRTGVMAFMRAKFTLIELLVVVAIIAILAAMLLPALNKARQKAKDASCLNNLKTYATAMKMYNDTYNGYFPPSGADAGVVGGKPIWIQHLRVFTGRGTTAYDEQEKKLKRDLACPAENKEAWQYGSVIGRTYSMNKELHYTNKDLVVSRLKKDNQLKHPAGTPMIYDAWNWAVTPYCFNAYFDTANEGGRTIIRHGGYNFAFCDGHVAAYRYTAKAAYFTGDFYRETNLWAP